MITLEKIKIFEPLQKLPKNVGVLGRLIVDTGLEKLCYAKIKVFDSLYQVTSLFITKQSN